MPQGVGVCEPLPGRTALEHREARLRGADAVAEAGPWRARVAGDDVTERERELGAIILAYNDVTDRLKQSHERLGHEVARLREELQAKNEELRRKERLSALGQMAAGLAHEIRNPLGGIALYASMLENELRTQPNARQAAGRISAGVRSLDDLVRAVLDFAQEGRVDRRRCRLGEVLDGIDAALEPYRTQFGNVVEISEDAQQVALDCDPIRMRQVILNLLSNALQSAGRDGNAWLKARPLSEQDAVEIEVLDDGPGIPEAHLEKIFNPFFTTRDKGTGLGLAITHRIVEAHGGSIQAMNRPEGGARFVIRIPNEVRG